MVAFTDMQGRLQGKRLHGRYFVEHVVGHGTEGCNYLLAVDVDMNTVDGYAISSWEQRLRRHGVRPRRADDPAAHPPAGDGDGPVRPGLARPHARSSSRPARSCSASSTGCAERGWTALSGTELEFIAFDTSYEQAHLDRYQDLTPVNQYNVDYSILGTTRVEPLLRSIRNHMYAAGIDVEGAKGECNFGQHEIGFLYAEAMMTADNHAVYKTAAKEIAAQQGKAITFMAKYNEREGNSCHIHLSLRGTDGELVFWDDDKGERTPLYDQLRRRRARDDRGLHPALRAEHQLLQAVRRRLVRAQHHRVGPRQPHLRGPPGRPRRRRPDGEPGARAAT